MPLKYGATEIGGSFVGVTPITKMYVGSTVVFSQGFEAPATSYSNPGGQGNRTASITASSSPAPSIGAISKLVDGATGSHSGASCFWSDGAAAGRWVKFDFATARYIDEVTWIQSATHTQGTWKWQKSNNDSDWTDIGSEFTLGGATSQVQSLASNTGAARYYRLLGVSGNYVNDPWTYEVEFKIDAGV